MTLVSYAQNFEDVMLWRALGDVEKGRYLDIGAQDPVVDSVSKAFYERGWRGWHVEPARMYSEALCHARPDENVLVAAVGVGGGLLNFHEFPQTGLSTLDADIAERHVSEGFERVGRSVAVVPLAAILDQMAIDGPIHWMKIDVEGAEQAVWRGMAGLLESPRPLTIILEFTMGRYEDPAAFIDQFTRHGFSLEVINPFGGIVPIDRAWLLLRPNGEDQLVVLRR